MLILIPELNAKNYFPEKGEKLQPGRLKKVLDYQNSFLSEEDFSHWTLEGPGQIIKGKGKMILLPLAQEDVLKKWQELGQRTLTREEYYDTVKKALAKKQPDIVDKLNNKKGKFGGGHIVSWNNKYISPDSYYIEYKFKPLSPIGLGIIFFSAKGINNEDIFDKTLQPRHGVFARYIYGDINCYHISYWANNASYGIRNSCNFRKNKGFYCVATGPDITVKGLDYKKKKFGYKTFIIGVLKKNNIIHFYIDNNYILGFEDKQFNDIYKDNKITKRGADTGSPLSQGRIGLRQMVGLKAEYSDFKVYKLLK